MPEIATQKISGLTPLLRHHGDSRAWHISPFTKKPTCAIALPGAIGSASEKDADSFGVLCAAERSLKALWGALDAVYPRACAAKN